MVNVVGILLETFYLMFYLLYTPNKVKFQIKMKLVKKFINFLNIKKKMIHQIVFLAMTTLLVCLYSFMYENSSNRAVNVIGYASSIIGV